MSPSRHWQSPVGKIAGDLQGKGKKTKSAMKNNVEVKFSQDKMYMFEVISKRYEHAVYQKHTSLFQVIKRNYRVVFLTGPPLKMSLDWPPPNLLGLAPPPNFSKCWNHAQVLRHLDFF